MADRDGKIWMDGQMVDWRDAKVHVLTHTLHYGCGVFEGVRAYDTVNGPAVFRLQEHTDRLFNSAKILRMKMPFSKDEINAAQLEAVRANGLKSGYIRPLVWLGSEKMGVSPKGAAVHVMVAAWHWGAYYTARPVGRCAERHNPQHGVPHCQRPGAGSGTKAHHPRRGLHC
jgi:branched-chain amino acid aminotransferase